VVEKAQEKGAEAAATTRPRKKSSAFDLCAKTAETAVGGTGEGDLRHR
jgi:hypothetical protein